MCGQSRSREARVPGSPMAGFLTAARNIGQPDCTTRRAAVPAIIVLSRWSARGRRGSRPVLEPKGCCAVRVSIANPSTCASTQNTEKNRWHARAPLLPPAGASCSGLSLSPSLFQAGETWGAHRQWGKQLGQSVLAAGAFGFCPASSPAIHVHQHTHPVTQAHAGSTSKNVHLTGQRQVNAARVDRPCLAPVGSTGSFRVSSLGPGSHENYRFSRSVKIPVTVERNR